MKLGHADAGWHGHIRSAVLDRCANDLVILVIADRKELARTARGEQPRRAERGQPLQSSPVASGVELAVRAEVRHRKRKQPGANPRLEISQVQSGVLLQ